MSHSTMLFLFLIISRVKCLRIRFFFFFFLFLRIEFDLQCVVLFGLRGVFKGGWRREMNGVLGLWR